nr:MAG TPA: hypothetical protein [Crassvirales sp.]
MNLLLFWFKDADCKAENKELFKNWFGDGIEQKIVESAIILV